MGFSLLTLFGFVLLLPALFSSSNRAPTPTPQGRRPQPYAAPKKMQPAPYQSQMKAPEPKLPPIPTSSESKPYTSNTSLFSGTMFPSFGQSMPSNQAAADVAKQTPGTTEPGQRDELLEMAAIIAIVRLFSA